LIALCRPAVIISFIVSGVSALLSALCYSEYAAEFPLAGGAYNYISMSLGELAAWWVVTTLILEYILANAAVSRAFSACKWPHLAIQHGRMGSV
jgi:APA family basic amino acid/polyamine antiporter